MLVDAVFVLFGSLSDSSLETCNQSVDEFVNQDQPPAQRAETLCK